MSTCRFCHQWNPPKAQRCAFCQNLLSDTEDRTRAGRTTMTEKQVASIPRAQKSMFASRRSGNLPHLTKSQWRMVAFAVLTIGGYLISAIFRHC
ncbi:MAG: hypothetical protein KAI47_23080 [Deltaproteobacteria bacterium]|nr:hypothetical protein [Deltaproteobacteria bacterium]